MPREKTDWDYFCELLTLVPGAVAMFEDGGTMGWEKGGAHAAYRGTGDARRYSDPRTSERERGASARE